MTLTPDERLKYTASATEQEIVSGALRVADAPEHVFCFFRKILTRNNLPLVADLPPGESAQDFVDLVKVGDEYQLNKEAHRLLEELKRDKLRPQLGNNIHNYEAQWTGNGITTDHLAKLCEDVLQSLSRVILAEIKQLEEVDPLEKESQDHASFGQERAKFFTGRAGILQTISDYVKGTDPHPLAVFGASGSGKTALLAQALADCGRQMAEGVIVSRFIGATPASSDGRALLESLCREISRRYGADEASVPAEYQKLVEELPRRLALATADKPLIVFIDALDQLSDFEHARNLIWLPRDLPAHVRLIVSTLDPGECLTQLERKLPAANRKELEPMPQEEGGKLLDLWLAEAGRMLQDEQRAEVLGKFAANGLPLYLKLAFEEARRWKSYSLPIRFGADIPGVVRELFRRLSADHGQMVVSRSLGYLAAAKNGLSEDELLDVLSLDDWIFQDFLQRARHNLPEKRLPVVVWSRLYFDLEAYLTEHSADGINLLSFYHGQLGEIVTEDYLAGNEKQNRHRQLAAYFVEQPLQVEKDGKSNPNLRKVSELPFQQTRGEMWEELELTLCDLGFIEAKCAVGMTYELMGDYALALDALPEAQAGRQAEWARQQRVERYGRELIQYASKWNNIRQKWQRDPDNHSLPKTGEIAAPEPPPSIQISIGESAGEEVINGPTRLKRIQAFSQFVHTESHNLAQYAILPGFCLQQVRNSMADGPVADAAEMWAKHAGEPPMVLLRRPSSPPRYNPHPLVLWIFEGHGGWVDAVAISSDGRTAVTASADGTLLLLDVESGERLAIARWRARGAVWRVSVAISADGRRVLFSNSTDNLLHVWDTNGGEEMRVLRGHSEWIGAVDLTPDGRLGLSVDREEARIWDLAEGKCLKVFEANRPAGMTADGQNVVFARGKDILVYDIWSSNPPDVLSGHQADITAIALSGNGNKCISASGDKTLRLWDVTTRECLQVLEGDWNYSFADICITADGRLTVVKEKSEIQIWEVEGAACRRIPFGVGSMVLSVDGRRLISGYNNGSVRLLDLERGRLPEPAEPRRTFTAISRQGRSVILTESVSSGEILEVIDLDTGERVCALSLTSEDQHVVALRNTGAPLFKLIADEGQLVFSESGGLSLWDLATGQCLNRIPLEFMEYITDHVPLSHVEFAADNRHLVAVTKSAPGDLSVIDLMSGECIRTIPVAPQIGCFTLFADGRYVVCGDAVGYLRVLDLETCECLNIWRAHWKKVTCVKVTADRRRIVSGSEDGILCAWDIVVNKKMFHVFAGSEVWDIGVSADGQRVVSRQASALREHPLQVWDMERGRLIQTLGAQVGFDMTSDGWLVVPGGTTVNFLAWNAKKDCYDVRHAISCTLKRNFALAGDIFVALDDQGLARFYSMPPKALALPLVTASYLYYLDSYRWSERPIVSCAWCARRFSVPEVSQEKTACPHCGRTLQLNPVVNDNRGLKAAYPSESIEATNRGARIVHYAEKTVFWTNERDSERAIESLEKCEALCREFGDDLSLERCYGYAAAIEQMCGRLDEAMALFQKQEKMSAELNDSEGRQSALAGEASILFTQGRLDEAMPLFKDAERICRELGNKNGLQNSLGSQGVILGMQGNPEAAMSLLKEQECLCRELGNSTMLVYCLCNQALVLAQNLGRGAEALLLAEEAYGLVSRGLFGVGTTFGSGPLETSKAVLLHIRSLVETDQRNRDA